MTTTISSKNIIGKMIPFLELGLDKKLLDEIEKQINTVVKSGNYILGPQLANFEKKFAKFTGVKHAVGVASGTDAIRLALRALGIGRGDRVLTVSATSPFTVIAILEEGVVPIFADIDEATLTLDVDDAERRVDKQSFSANKQSFSSNKQSFSANKKIKAVVPVHIYGNPCDMPRILAFAKKHKIAVIEDACQAHGAQLEGKRVGSFGECGAFSFYPTKNLGALGDGGMVTTSNLGIYNMIKSLRHGGQTKRFWHKYRGVNSRLDEIQAAILAIKLRKLDSFNKKRVILAERYKKNLGGLPIKFQQSYPTAKPVYHLFVIRTKKRNALMRYLAQKGIASYIYYPYPVHRQPAFGDFYDARKSLPVTDRISGEILALPLSPNLTFRNQDKIIRETTRFFRRS
mgnify:FL=1